MRNIIHGSGSITNIQGNNNQVINGDNNKAINGDKVTNENCINLELSRTLQEYLDEVLIKSSNEAERKCAVEVKKLCKDGKSDKMKKFIFDNLQTLMTGTFSNVAGGMLCELLKSIIK